MLLFTFVMILNLNRCEIFFFVSNISVCPDAGARRVYLVCPQCGGGIYAVVAEMTKLQSAAGRQQQWPRHFGHYDHALGHPRRMVPATGMLKMHE